MAKTIYLNIEKQSTTYNCWSEERTNSSDIEYILKSEYDELKKQNEEFTKFIATLYNENVNKINMDIIDVCNRIEYELNKITGKPIEEILK